MTSLHFAVVLRYWEQIIIGWYRHRPVFSPSLFLLFLHADIRATIVLPSQTITRAAVTYKRNFLMDQWAEREARQQTASVSLCWATRRHADAGGRLGMRRRAGSECRLFPYLLRGPRAEPLQESTQDYPILQGGLQKCLGIWDGLLWRFQHPERNQPCNRLFRRIHVQSQQIRFNKAAVFWYLSSSAPWLRCHLCVRTGTALIQPYDAWYERECVCRVCCGKKGGGTVPRVDADDGWLVEIQQVCFPPSNLESCQVRFVVMRRGSGLHTCASQPPAACLLDDITGEGQACPTSCWGTFIVSWIGFYCVALHILPFHPFLL